MLLVFFTLTVSTLVLMLKVQKELAHKSSFCALVVYHWVQLTLPEYTMRGTTEF